jgi:uncharacterized repeat protein (TIGR01451 family)
LSCGFNQLTSLPSLPTSLRALVCGPNQLTSLPILPTSLGTLVCFDNQLSSLPNLPNNMLVLFISNNQLTSLPTLPNNLENLSCENNQLSRLPVLPGSLTELNCSDNPQLYCLPFLPQSLQTCIITNTAIVCIPNMSNIFFVGFPICNSPSLTCSGSTWAMGKVYHDANTNGIYDVSEQQLSGLLISNTTNNFNSLSTINGYNIQVDSGIPSSISFNNSFSSAWIIAPATYSVTATATGQIPGSFDFGLQAVGTVHEIDVNIATQQARPGFQTSATATIENIGNQVENNVEVKIIVPTGWTYDSSVPAGGIFANGEVVWSGVSLALFESKAFTVFSTLPTTTPLGTAFSYIASAYDGTNYPFTGSCSGVVVGSFDPNDKLTNKPTLPSNYVASEEEIIYTIRFQNTGTASAINVEIFDEISPKLDMRTLKVVNASHAYQAKIHGERYLVVNFPNINLIDSFANEPESHGFVQVSIKPIAGLAPGTDINNQAGIYFDFNEPIYTNTIVTSISCFTAHLSGPADYTVCEGSPMTLSTAAYGGSGNYTYHWSNGQNTASINPVVNRPTVFTVTISDGSGCPNLIREVILNPIEGPEAKYFTHLDPNGMPAYTIFAINNSDVTNNTCHWDFGDGNTSNDNFPTHIYANTGVYPLCLTLTNNTTGCTNTFCHNMGIDANGNIFRQGFTLNIYPPTFLSVDAAAEKFPLSVFPNPNDGTFTLQTELIAAGDVNIEVIDLLGKVVHTQVFAQQSAGKLQLPINVQNLSSAIYVLRATSNGQIATVKLRIGN